MSVASCCLRILVQSRLSAAYSLDWTSTIVVRLHPFSVAAFTTSAMGPLEDAIPSRRITMPTTTTNGHPSIDRVAAYHHLPPCHPTTVELCHPHCTILRTPCLSKFPMT